MQYITLLPRKEQSLERKHPWIFSGAIKSASDTIEEGDIVEVRSSNDEFLCLGHSAVGSISVRVLSFENVEINQEWWNQRIADALEARKVINLPNEKTNCYRAVHGEGDLLPGLIIDIYNHTAVIQCHSVGMYLERSKISLALQNAMGDDLHAVYDKSKNTIPPKSDITTFDSYIYKADGYKGEGEIIENGHKFQPNWEEGQKTGFFLDQRDNRELVAYYAKNRRVLNTFCYTGGFSVYALANGATKCTSVDSSEKAIRLCKSNIELNNPTGEHNEVVTDALQFVREMEKDAYDLVILDPPAFAKHQGALNNALQGYKRLNAKAMASMPKNSILFTFSCSQAVSKDLFRQAIFSAAVIAKREVKILHFLSQGADHPVNIYHPEGEYLKGLVLLVQ